MRKQPIFGSQIIAQGCYSNELRTNSRIPYLKKQEKAVTYNVRTERSPL